MCKRGPALGIDIGSVAVKAVLLDSDGNVLRREQNRISGRTLPTVRRVVTRILHDMTDEFRVCVTGGGKGTLARAEVPSENDLISSARAAARLHPGVRGICEVGGHQSKWIRIGQGGEMESFSLNDQCAAGSGAFLEQQSSRLKLGIDSFSLLAAQAERGASIAGRCSVFAKSDMIHQQQKGTPPAEIAYGLCRALALNFRATLLRGGELATPALMAGGGGCNRGLVRAFRETFGLAEDTLIQPASPEYLAAHGAALAALDGNRTWSTEAFLLLLEGCDSQPDAGTGALPPLAAPPGRVLPEPVAPAEGPIEAWLGIDVGSVSTDFCLLAPDGEVLDGIYLRTRGDPVGVLREGLRLLRERVGDRLHVLGVGTTGSGRHLAGRLVGADVVKNEITCQLIGARHLLPEVDTILEIGGQDSKYVSVREGRIADFVMNKICAAGTGSFLEEQAEGLGIAIEGEFEERALAAKAPRDLGSQCTVFMDTEVVAARQQGCEVEDILAGLACSVVRNYLERVVSGRPVGEHVVFQGGVASNRAVVAAFEQLLGKPVAVHPYNRISGAIGAALAAQEEHRGESTAFRGLDAVEEVAVRTFECPSCSNLCQVSRLTVAGRTSFFGDVCEKYTARDGVRVPQVIPDLPGEVEDRLQSYAGGDNWVGTVGIPRASLMYDQLPYWATLFRSLGFRVLLSRPSNGRTLEEGVRRLTAETCLPIKLSFGHVAELVGNEEVDFVFLPSILDLPEGTEARGYLCPFEESVGFMTATFARDRLRIPALFLSWPRPRLVRALCDCLAEYEIAATEMEEALDAAEDAYRRFRTELVARGQEALARHEGPALALLGKPYNVIDSFQNLNLADHARRLGLLPLPIQMVQGADMNLGERGISLPWAYNRDIVRALQTVGDDPRLFPVIISNFGCGPDAFAGHYIEPAVRDTPCLTLEFDEHRGEAGMVTRLEAFLDEVRSSMLGERPRELLLSGASPIGKDRFAGRRFVIPFFADHAWAYYGALRHAGHEVVVLPRPDDATIAHGERLSSGKECHPFVLLAGDLLKHLELGTIGEGDIYFFPGTSIPCLMHEYGQAMRMALTRSAAKGVEVLTPDSATQFELFGMASTIRLGRGLLACEQLTKLRCQVRPYAVEPATVNRLFDEAFAAMGDALAEDRLGDVLGKLGQDLGQVERREIGPLPMVGVAGDIYTRIHPFGNRNLFEKLEALGLEVWPAPFLVDISEFGMRKEMVTGMDDGNYRDAFAASLLFLRKEWESFRVRYLLGTRVERADEPGYDDVISLAAPYVAGNASEILVLNVAKMVDFARRGAAGVINAISFHCMLGTVSASLTENIRRDHHMIPLMTLVYSGAESPEMDTRLEAFAHQVKAFAAGRPDPLPSLSPMARLRETLKTFR